jgi:hypothetical protein
MKCPLCVKSGRLESGFMFLLGAAAFALEAVFLTSEGSNGHLAHFDTSAKG